MADNDETYTPERLLRAERMAIGDHVHLPGVGAGVVVGRHSPYTVAVSFAGAREVLVSATRLETAGDDHGLAARDGVPGPGGHDGIAASTGNAQLGLF